MNQYLNTKWGTENPVKVVDDISKGKLLPTQSLLISKNVEYLYEIIQAGGIDKILEFLLQSNVQDFNTVLPSTSSSTSTSTSTWLRDLMREVESQHAVFGSTIFVLTSQVGTTTMEKWTRKRLQSQAQQQQQQSHQHHNDNDNDNERRKLLMATSTTTAPTAQMMLTSEVESMLRYEIRGYHSTTTS
jgi:hypothetical protein